jgi:hypothetical protein
VSPASVKWAYPNIHGDLLETASGTGVVDSQVYRWDPDGVPIAGGMQPNLQASNFENGWLGQHQRMTDTTDAANPIVEMGARVSLPRLAKFTAPDPIEGGVGDADYLYPTDPINGMDLSGNMQDVGGAGSTTNCSWANAEECAWAWLWMEGHTESVLEAAAAGVLAAQCVSSAECDYRNKPFFLASTLSTADIVECFSGLRCALAAGSTIILGGAVAGAACVVTVGVGCVAASALASTLSTAVIHIEVNGRDGLVCASVIGAAGGGAGRVVTGVAAKKVGAAVAKKGAKSACG